jgi:hypothetical protein
MLLHLLVVLQWMLLILSLVFNINVSVAVTTATLNGYFKVITIFQVWLLLYPVIFCLALYRVSENRRIRSMFLCLSILATLFAIANISLHFVNNLVLLMKATEVAAWTFYNSLFAVSLYQLLSLLLTQSFKRQAKVESAAQQRQRNVG